MNRIKVKPISEAERKDVSSAVDEYIQNCRLRNLSPRTIEYYWEDLTYFIRCMNLQFADEITREVVDQLVLHEMDKGNRATAINTRLRGIRIFVRFCAERGYLEGFKYPLMKVDQQIKEPYTDEELRRLLKRPRGNKWSEWRSWAAINTFLATGIRANTLINLRVKDVDFKQNIIFLQKLKNRKQQTLPLSKSLKDALQVYLKLWDWNRESYLFPTNSNTQMTVHTLDYSVRRYNHSRGVEKTSLHLFRHTFAKNYILAGGGMVQLQAILGHSTLDMTRKYVNLYGQDVNRDFDNLNPLNNIMRQG